MAYGIDTPDVFIPFERGRLSRKIFAQTVPGAAALAVSGLVGAWMLYGRPAIGPALDRLSPIASRAAHPPKHAAFPPVLAPLRHAAARAIFPPALMPLRHERAALAANPYGSLINPTFSLGYTPVPLAQSGPLGANFVSAAPAPDSTKVAAAEEGTIPSIAAVSPSDQSIPLPAPRPEDVEGAATESPVLPPQRPPEFGSLGDAASPRQSEPEVAQQNVTSVPQAAAPDQGNFFQKLFGIRRNRGQRLAYASEEQGLFGSNAQRATSGVALPYDRWTAVYNIAAHTVYLPDGTRLEAHSGLGAWIDDPRHVNAKMRGATPPDVYELRPREQLFHGVQALRLIPVGTGDLHGRTGLLAHTYMLGPNGQSFGCVSFKNYRKFLEAYQRGEVKRLVVVAGL